MVRLQGSRYLRTWKRRLAIKIGDFGIRMMRSRMNFHHKLILCPGRVKEMISHHDRPSRNWRCPVSIGSRSSIRSREES